MDLKIAKRNLIHFNFTSEAKAEALASQRKKNKKRSTQTAPFYASRKTRTRSICTLKTK